MPLAPSTRAGTTAQRCGCAVNRVESPARSAQPIAKPHRTAPVSAPSVAGTTGAATSATAARNPATAEPATTRAMVGAATGGEPTGGAQGAVLAEEDGATFGLMRVGVVMAGSDGCGGGERVGATLWCWFGGRSGQFRELVVVLLAVGEEL